MAQTIAMTIQMKRSVVQSHVQITFTNAKTPSVSSKRTFVMVKMTVVTDQMKAMSMLVSLLHSDVPLVNGLVLV
jgi:hypothetical protein